MYEGWKAERVNFDQTYQEIIDQIDPHHKDVISERMAGQRKNWRQFDGTALYASSIFADFYQGSVFNQGTKWFSIKHREKAINDKPDNVRWMNLYRDIGLQHMRGFYGAGGQAMGSWALFGNGPVLVEEVQNKKPHQAYLKYTSVPWGQYVMAEGEDGKIDKFIRCLKLPAYQIVQMFGAANVSEEIAKAASTGGQEMLRSFDILHSILPRDMQTYSKSAIKSNKQYDWASCWVEAAKKKLLKESGYRKFPVAVARYKLISGEVYARGLGEVALADAKSLNLMDEMSLLKAGRELDPPMLIRRGSIIGGILNQQRAGKTIVTDINNSVKALFEKSDWPAFKDMQERKTTQLMRVFHVSEIINLLSRETPQLTAFEVNARLTLLQQILGPVFGLNDMDFFNPVIDLTLDNLAHIGLIPDPPDEIAQDESDDAMQFIFEGPLARAQRNQELINIQQSVADTAGMQPFFPEIVKMVNWESMARAIYSIRGTDQHLVGEDDFAKITADLQKQATAQKAAGLIAGGAEAAGKAAPFMEVLRKANDPTAQAAA